MKKRFLKANQYIGEKLGVSQRETSYEGDFRDLETKFQSITNMLFALADKTEEMLQPNPQIRVKIRFKEGMDKLTKNAVPKEAKYPQIEAGMAMVMSKGASEVAGIYGSALSEISEHFNAISELRDKLENDIRTTTLESIAAMKENEIKEIVKCKKRLSSRRLELDSLKSKKSISPEEIKLAQDRFTVSNIDTYNVFLQFSENSEDRLIKQILDLAEALDSFFRGCSILSSEMVKSLRNSLEQAKGKPKTPLKARPVLDDDDFDSTNQVYSHDADGYSQGHRNDPSPLQNSSITSVECNQDQDDWENDSRTQHHHTRTVKAMYDFVGESSDELTFKVGDMLTILSEIDENWYLGESKDGSKGMFPKNFVTEA